jgi:hypothetical protein
VNNKLKEKKMKLTNQSGAFLFTMLIAAVISMEGCASTDIQRSSETLTTMQTVDDDIKLIVVQLDATGASLDRLIKTGQSDVRMAFDVYTENISNFEEMEKNFAKHADEMQARGKDYFEGWQKDGTEYKNPQIQELSEQRRIQLDELYGSIAKNSLGAKEAFKAYVSDAKEIQIYLSNDLTSNGIEAIRPISRKLINDGDSFKYVIKDIQKAIERAREEMSRSGV